MKVKFNYNAIMWNAIPIITVTILPIGLILIHKGLFVGWYIFGAGGLGILLVCAYFIGTDLLEKSCEKDKRIMNHEANIKEE